MNEMPEKSVDKKILNELQIESRKDLLRKKSVSNSLPVPIALDKEGAKEAMKMLKDAEAHQAFMQQFMQVGQQRQAVLKAKQTKFWQDMADKHGIDIQNISWAPSDDGSQLVPVSVNLVNGVQG